MVIWKYTDVFRGIFRVGDWEEGGMLGEFSLEEFVMGKENFHEGSAGFSSIIWKKKQWKNKYEEVFSTESKEKH